MTDPDPALTADQLAAYLDLIEVAGLLRQSIDRQLREAGGLSYLQFQMLAKLGDSPTGGCRMTELADGVVHSPSGVTYQTGLLESEGLVVRSPSPGDDRGVVVTITDAGRALLQRVFPGHIEITQRMLYAPLDESDVTALAEVLGRVRTHMRATPRRLPRRAKARPATD